MSWDQARWEKGFQLFYRNIKSAFASFHTWKNLQKKDYNVIFNKNKFFWASILDSLREDFLVSLARAYEDSNFTKVGGATSSAFAICNNVSLPEALIILTKNQPLFDKLRGWRDQTLMHSDIDYPLPQINNGDIENILQISIDLLPLLDPNKNEYLFTLYQGDISRDTNAFMRKIASC